MKTRVYFSGPKGSVEMVAEACMEEIRVITGNRQQNKDRLYPAYMPEGVTLLFLGLEDAGGKPDKTAISFIATLDVKRVANVALFGTSHKESSAFLDHAREMLTKQGVNVLKETFLCKGKGGLLGGGKMPDDADLKNAREFVKRAAAPYKDA